MSRVRRDRLQPRPEAAEVTPDQPHKVLTDPHPTPGGAWARRPGAWPVWMGLIIGLLGKFVAPGDRDNIPHWLTVLCGIAGVLIGYYFAAALVR
jgi:hypothetical protein